MYRQSGCIRGAYASQSLVGWRHSVSLVRQDQTRSKGIPMSNDNDSTLDKKKGEHRVVDEKTGGEKCRKLCRPDLIPPDALTALAEHYGKCGGDGTPGSEKYSENNWLKGYNWSLSLGAAWRHLLAFASGEAIDPDTGTLHTVAAAWHCMSLTTYQMRGLGTDDRVKVTEPKSEFPKPPVLPAKMQPKAVVLSMAEIIEPMEETSEGGEGPEVDSPVQRLVAFIEDSAEMQTEPEEPLSSQDESPDQENPVMAEDVSATSIEEDIDGTKAEREARYREACLEAAANRIPHDELRVKDFLYCALGEEQGTFEQRMWLGLYPGFLEGYGFACLRSDKQLRIVLMKAYQDIMNALYYLKDPLLAARESFLEVKRMLNMQHRSTDKTVGTCFHQLLLAAAQHAKDRGELDVYAQLTDSWNKPGTKTRRKRCEQAIRKDGTHKWDNTTGTCVQCGKKFKDVLKHVEYRVEGKA